MTTSFEKSSEEDIPKLVQLINSAFRGESAKKGWTHEADLIEGPVRIDEPSLKQMINKEDAVVLKCVQQDHLTGCVYLEKQGNKMYLGMLTVSPLLQGMGIGKKLLHASEEWATKVGCSSIFMNVISDRAEIIDWYVRHGYRITDETKPFPDDERFGKPVKPLEFIILRKEI